MEDSHLVKKYKGHAAAFSFTDLRAEVLEERFNILPMDICTRKVSVQSSERALMLPLHANHVRQAGRVLDHADNAPAPAGRAAKFDFFTNISSQNAREMRTRPRFPLFPFQV